MPAQLPYTLRVRVSSSSVLRPATTSPTSCSQTRYLVPWVQVEHSQLSPEWKAGPTEPCVPLSSVQTRRRHCPLHRSTMLLRSRDSLCRRPDSFRQPQLTACQETTCSRCWAAHGSCGSKSASIGHHRVSGLWVTRSRARTPMTSLQRATALAVAHPDGKAKAKLFWTWRSSWSTLARRCHTASMGHALNLRHPGATIECSLPLTSYHRDGVRLLLQRRTTWRLRQ